jgi:hypothetical protein
VIDGGVRGHEISPTDEMLPTPNLNYIKIMKHTHCQIKVIDYKDVTTFAKVFCKKGWVYAFIKYKNGDIILSEVMLIDGKGGCCPASSDIVDKKIFDECVKNDKDFYDKITWEQYRSDILKDLLFPITMDCR